MSDQRNPDDVLARAQRAWLPTAADSVRVRRAVDAAVSISASATSKSPLHAAAPWATRLLVASALVATSGGIGYWRGYRAGHRDTRPTALADAARPSAMPLEKQRPGAPPTPTTPPPAIAAPALLPPHHDNRPARHGTGTEARTATESLAAEVQGLRNAERALRDGNPGLALAFLAELDRQVPRGQLTEERDAASTLARCASGERPFGVDLGEEFAARHPSSVYRARVEQACAATDSAAAGDSRNRRSDP